MTGPQHWAEADLILTGDSDPCAYGCPHSGCEHEMSMLTRAIAHAIQANTAAVIAGTAHMLRPADWHEWQKAIDPEYAAEQNAEATI